MIKTNTGLDNIPFEKQHVAVGMVAKKDNERSGCGVVIQSVDKENWIASSKIAALWKKRAWP